MISLENSTSDDNVMPYDDRILADLPDGSQIQQVSFVSQPADGQKLLFKFPHRINAVLVNNEKKQDVSGKDLLLLTVPTTNQDDIDLLEKAGQWVDAVNPEHDYSKSHMLTFQGTRIYWSERRIVVFAKADRLDSICTALIEASFYEAEMREIEDVVAESWPMLEEDIPLAFDFDDKSLPARQRLSKRFQQTQLIRARLSKIAPHVHYPHIYPPTLASQIGERLREWNRTCSRHEFLDEQVEVYEEVYDMCAQRSSEYILARKGHILEWLIIILLMAQILLWGFEIITSVG